MMDLTSKVDAKTRIPAGPLGRLSFAVARIATRPASPVSIRQMIAFASLS